jgi:beta-lactamase regulating signal transducer with metallopeptidase domain
VLPSLLALVFPSVDHCLAHDDDHVHLCFVHLPQVDLHPAVAAGLLVLFALAIARAAASYAKLTRALGVWNVLARTGQQDAARDATIIEIAEPICVAAGIVRPRILVSRGLLEELDPEAQRVVLAHERAHVLRRDALSAALVRLLSQFHLSAVADWLVRESDVAAEQACDENAAEAVGDRLRVASVILQVQRMVQGHQRMPSAPAAVALVQHAVERRVTSLLEDAPPPTSLSVPSRLLALGATLLLACAGELHHITEFLLSRLTR